MELMAKAIPLAIAVAFHRFVENIISTIDMQIVKYAPPIWVIVVKNRFRHFFLPFPLMIRKSKQSTSYK